MRRDAPRAASPPRVPARSRRRASAGRGDRAAARLTVRCGSPSSRTSTATSSRSTRSWPHAGTVDAVWHLGDVVGYGPDPDAVVARLDASSARSASAATTMRPRCGGDEIDCFNPEARAAMEWTRAAHLPATTRAWLRGPPGAPDRGRRSRSSTAARAIPTWEYVTIERRRPRQPGGPHDAARPPRPHPRADRLARWPAAGVHGDAPRRRRHRRPSTSRRAFLNPGSVGQPRDGDPRASYLVLDPEAGTATWHRVAYDIEAVAAAMRAPACRRGSPSGCATVSDRPQPVLIPTGDWLRPSSIGANPSSSRAPGRRDAASRSTISETC